jgi:hypothetical protein
VLDPYAPDLIPPDPFDRRGDTGKLRLQIEPRDADVFVDGVYGGIVDDFDGVFQRMTLTPGPHHIVVQRPGYEPLAFDVAIDPHRAVTYKGVLQR